DRQTASGRAVARVDRALLVPSSPTRALAAPARRSHRAPRGPVTRVRAALRARYRWPRRPGHRHGVLVPHGPAPGIDGINDAADRDLGSQAQLPVGATR